MAKKNFTSGLDSLLGGSPTPKNEKEKGLSVSTEEEVEPQPLAEEKAIEPPQPKNEVKKPKTTKNPPVKRKAPTKKPATPVPEPEKVITAKKEEKPTPPIESTPKKTLPKEVEAAEETPAPVTNEPAPPKPPKEKPAPPQETPAPVNISPDIVAANLKKEDELLEEVFGKQKLANLEKVAKERNMTLSQVLSEGIGFYLDFQMELQKF